MNQVQEAGIWLANKWRESPIDMGFSLYDTARVARLVGDDQPLYPNYLKLLTQHIRTDGGMGIESDQWQVNLIANLATINTFIAVGADKYADEIRQLLKYLLINIDRINEPDQVDISNSDMLFASEIAILQQHGHQYLSEDEWNLLLSQLQGLIETAQNRARTFSYDNFLKNGTAEFVLVRGFFR